MSSPEIQAPRTPSPAYMLDADGRRRSTRTSQRSPQTLFAHSGKRYGDIPPTSNPGAHDGGGARILDTRLEFILHKDTAERDYHADKTQSVTIDDT